MAVLSETGVTRDITPLGYRLQRIRHDVRRHPWLERPANNFPIEQIKNNVQIQPEASMVHFVRPKDESRPDFSGVYNTGA